MVQELTYDQHEVLDFVESYPSVSIILPFEPKMAVHRDLEYQLQRVFDRVVNELSRNYTPESITPVTDRLKSLITNIDFTTFKKSVAIFVSPTVENIYYFDIPVEERVSIDEPFEICDLVYSKKDVHKYLVLKLGEKHSEIFLGNNEDFFCIVTNTSGNTGVKDISRQPKISSNPGELYDETTELFLQHVDNILGHILNAYDLPLFVIGTPESVQQFETITHHNDRVINYVKGNYAGLAQAGIKKVIAPYVGDWKTVKEKDLILRLSEARGSKKLATGIQEVWQQATNKKGRLLIVEKSYMYSGQEEVPGYTNYQKSEISDSAFLIKDTIDDVIVKVLENGGDVEFVEEGLLRDYRHIALIQQYYQ